MFVCVCVCVYVRVRVFVCARMCMCACVCVQNHSEAVYLGGEPLLFSRLVSHAQ